jgi:CheY-like chemotaxis protein
LVVDDEPGIAEVLTWFLEAEGHEVESATNGAEALERVAEQTPDLVLCDVMMPVLDGVTLVDRLRADARWAALPVVLMTAVVASVPARVHEKISGLLQKPFTLDSVVELIGRALSARPPRR